MQRCCPQHVALPVSLGGLQALFCQVPIESVLTMHDVSNIWRVPLLLQARNRSPRTLCGFMPLCSCRMLSVCHVL